MKRKHAHPVADTIAGGTLLVGVLLFISRWDAWQPLAFALPTVGAWLMWFVRFDRDK